MRGPRVRYDCDSTEPLRPSGAHYSWHHHNGTKKCRRSRMERQLARRMKRAGHADGYEYGRYRDSYDCESIDNLEPHSGHAAFHQRNGEEPCLPAKMERSMYQYRNLHRTLEGWEYFGRGHLEDAPTKVYQISFLGGDRYYGITAGPINLREAKHRVATTAVGKRMRSGEAYVMEVLAVAPDRRRAEDLERALIRACDPDLLLNVKNAERGV